MTTEEKRRRHRDYMREYFRKHPEKNRAKVKQWRKENPEKFKEQRKLEVRYQSERRKADPEKYRLLDRKHDLNRYFKLSTEGYKQQLTKQQGVCAICKSPDPSRHNLAVDHDHNCCPAKKT